ncbi:hypothetical protein [Paracoccus sp. SCSIO 75233]|uniref:hypothetical protein n=1 Tax=Paracoccus sp. SCSIO 75233 TaxID=3017782 RepID=UPI0022F08007|nr:hypothetical protein [Paracoccus sp. SCSIO 75233]WBU54360.1 hypothetical protein PAF12_05870 [Paracoccus sp. SCSIO 75233]
MPDYRLTIIIAPSMPVFTPEVTRALRHSGAEIVVNPLAGCDDIKERREKLIALAAEDARRIVLLPASSVWRLGALQFLLPQARYVRLDTDDLVRPVLRALRAEAWISAGQADGSTRSLPIPQDVSFRPRLNRARFENMIYAIYVGRAMMNAALDGCSAIRMAANATDVGKLFQNFEENEVSSISYEPLEELVRDADELRSLIRDQRIPCPDVLPPALPALHPGAPRLMAFMCGRNVADYLPVLAARMQDEDVKLVYIDNESGDGSHEIASDLCGRGITAVERLSFDGEFSLINQLNYKSELISRYGPRWVLNIDADEIIEHREPRGTLISAIEDAECNDFNALTLNEFVFLPLNGSDHSGADYTSTMRHYYFYEPTPFRLLRIWRNGEGLSNLHRGGHYLSGPLRLSPVAHNLRHYIALSEDAAREKYVGRKFSQAELAQNWHRNRTGIDEQMIRMPDPNSALIRTLSPDAMRGFDRSTPLSQHWWQWTPDQRAAETPALAARRRLPYIFGERGRKAAWPWKPTKSKP